MAIIPCRCAGAMAGALLSPRRVSTGAGRFCGGADPVAASGGESVHAVEQSRQYGDSREECQETVAGNLPPDGSERADGMMDFPVRACRVNPSPRLAGSYAIPGKPIARGVIVNPLRARIRVAKPAFLSQSAAHRTLAVVKDDQLRAGFCVRGRALPCVLGRRGFRAGFVLDHDM